MLHTNDIYMREKNYKIYNVRFQVNAADVFTIKRAKEERESVCVKWHVWNLLVTKMNK